MTSHDPDPHAPQPWPVVALAGWVLPGLGHMLLGETRRGVIVCVTLLSLFTAGLMIGGVDVIDRREDTLWFSGQVLIGPATFALDSYHQHLKQELGRQIDATGELGRSDDAERKRRLLHLLNSTSVPAYRRSLGRVNELGTLYCTLAGVLNLLAIFDAIGRATSEPEPQPQPAPEGGAA